MSYAQAIRVDCEEVKVAAAASILSTYIPIGGFADFSDPANPIFNGMIEFPTRAIMIQNLTDGTLMFSNDGIRDKFPLVPGAFMFDVTSNANKSGGAYLAARKYWWVKQLEVPTSGSVYVTNWYGDDGSL